MVAPGQRVLSRPFVPNHGNSGSGAEDEMVRWLTIGVLAGALGAATLASAEDARQVERGKAVFVEQKCKTCHQVAGQGNPKGPLDGIGGKLTPDEIKQWLVNPKEMAEKAKATRKPPMKSFDKLSAADIDALIAYVSSLKK
jgi:mono/diheme cytochrome c family protein